jgi:DNA-binding transcriptional regulator YiaG
MNRTGIPNKYRKPKERRKITAAWVKSVRALYGDSQPQFASRLTKEAVVTRSPYITSVWSVAAWEKERREPDEPRRKLIERLERRAHQEARDREEAERARLTAPLGILPR